MREAISKIKVENQRLAAVVKGEENKLCHMRLGHPSSTTMKSMNLENDVNNEVLNKCLVCPLAKQARLVFPISSSRT